MIPSYAIGQMQKLEVLTVFSCNSIIEVFESQGYNNNNDVIAYVDGGNHRTCTTLTIPGLKNINVPQLY